LNVIRDTTIATTSANLRAHALACAVRPRWVGVGTAQELLGLSGRVLLHAGPPLADPTQPPKSMLNAAVQASLFEGWAQDEATVQAMIHTGDICLQGSFHYRASTPLVAMISPSSSVVAIDGGKGLAQQRWHGFLGTGAGAQMRFGARDLKVLERLQFKEQVLAKGFDTLLKAGPIDLLSAARAGLHEGDELHSRLNGATQVLQAMFESRKIRSEQVNLTLAMLADTPAYFLNMWIPACTLMLDAAVGQKGSSLVTRCSANGETISLQVAGLPGRWFCAPATKVQGPFMPNVASTTSFPPVVGDSAVIDAFGLGGQALNCSPLMASAFDPWMPREDSVRAEVILIAKHPVLEVLVGLDALAVVKSGHLPLLSLGMVSPDGDGLLGRGLCKLPLQPFIDAVAALAETA
jgi:hypothetical protein